MTDKLGQRQPNKFDKIEQIAKIVSLLVIPIIVALIGWKVQQKSVENEMPKLEFNLAAQIILKKESDENIRHWALQVINSYSSIQIQTKNNFSKREYILMKAKELSLMNLDGFLNKSSPFYSAAQIRRVDTQSNDEFAFKIAKKFLEQDGSYMATMGSSIKGQSQGKNTPQ